jgi:ArsR family transcriptional regulator
MYNTPVKAETSKPLEKVEHLMHALADSTRLRLLSMMRNQEICVCYFTAVLDAPQPTVSRHLSYLRSKGLVEARREGKWMHYRLLKPAEKALSQALNQVLEAAATDPQVQADSKRLKSACCDPKRLIGIADAPLPQRLTS